ncbi:MAG: NAD(P)(+) transhydrogenase (Re/Si-specific) subunit beta [Allorhizobium sp.]
MAQFLTLLLSVCASILFAIALRRVSLSKAESASLKLAAAGMALAITAALLATRPDFGGVVLIILGLTIGGGAGAWVAVAVRAAHLPQLLTCFVGLCGGACILLGAVIPEAPASLQMGGAGPRGFEALVAAAVAAGAGALALAGSLAICTRRAGLKIRYVLTPRRATSIALAGMLVLTALLFVSTGSGSSFVVLVLVSLLLGAHVPLAMEISEIPVAIPLVTCAAGLAGAAIGFAFDNLALIITGGLIVSSMTVLAMAMCRDTGRYLVSVVLGER